MTDIRFEGAAGNVLVGEVCGPEASQGGGPVLLLHGGGQTRFAWTRTADAIAAAGMRAYSVDQRGHGDSDWVADGAYAVGDFGADLECMAADIHRREGRFPVVVGASLGGLAALSVEATSPAPLFSGLVLVDVTPSLAASGLLRIQGFMTARLDDGFASVEEAAEAVAGYLPVRDKPASLNGLSRNLRPRGDGRLRWHWDPAFIGGERSILSEGEDGASRLRDAARRLRMPTLLVRGARSEIVTETELAEFRALAPAAEFVDIAGAGHMVAGDRNDAFAGAVLDFLERHGFARTAAMS